MSKAITQFVPIDGYILILKGGERLPVVGVGLEDGLWVAMLFDGDSSSLVTADTFTDAEAVLHLDQLDDDGDDGGDGNGE